MDIKTFSNHLFAFLLLLGGGLISLYEPYIKGGLSVTKVHLFSMSFVAFILAFAIYILIVFRSLKND